MRLPEKASAFLPVVVFIGSDTEILVPTYLTSGVASLYTAVPRCHIFGLPNSGYPLIRRIFCKGQRCKM